MNKYIKICIIYISLAQNTILFNNIVKDFRDNEKKWN